MTATTLAIIDDQPIARSGLEQVAAALPGITVTASVSTVDELCAEAAHPDVALLHLSSHDGLSIETLARLAATSRTVVISAWDGRPGLLAAIQAGARACLSRNSTHQSVAHALTVVADGGLYLCEKLIRRLHIELNRSTANDAYGLAPRELETLQWIARGLTHAQIAKRMGLTLATIDTYAKRIRSKVNAANKAELTRVAFELGMADRHDVSAA